MARAYVDYFSRGITRGACTGHPDHFEKREVGELGFPCTHSTYRAGIARKGQRRQNKISIIST